MTSQVGPLIGDHHEMEGARRDRLVTAGAEILLGGRIGLDRRDSHPEKIAHANTAIVANTAKTTIAMSAAVLSCSRNGLKPTTKR